MKRRVAIALALCVSAAAASAGRNPSAEEIVAGLLGLIPARPEMDANLDGVIDFADVVTAISLSSAAASLPAGHALASLDISDVTLEVGELETTVNIEAANFSQRVGFFLALQYDSSVANPNLARVAVGPAAAGFIVRGNVLDLGGGTKELRIVLYDDPTSLLAPNGIAVAIPFDIPANLAQGVRTELIVTNASTSDPNGMSVGLVTFPGFIQNGEAPVTSVEIFSPNTGVLADASVNFTAEVEPPAAGVTWSLRSADGELLPPGEDWGELSNITGTQVTYTAPSRLADDHNPLRLRAEHSTAPSALAEAEIFVLQPDSAMSADVTGDGSVTAADGDATLAVILQPFIASAEIMQRIDVNDDFIHDVSDTVRILNEIE